MPGAQAMTDGGYRGNPVTDNRRCRGETLRTPAARATAPHTPPAASPSCATWPTRSDRPPRGAITCTTNAFAH
ncbi:hypothetical protein AORI_5374 [Amycolatopsis keratiniphila]|uniref:Uncharacterized protein n=1 Tax=Amycolatopsis keratiniphila TaxID=129921 RepID=R4TAW1_9PSEU|nr:hypothetical protein AORI_5374 [Amycolatopsis keratiniphila]